MIKFIQSIFRFPRPVQPLRCFHCRQSKAGATNISHDGNVQVASHAQKYFLREGLPASRREKRRPSIHDIRSATETSGMSADERCKLRSSLQILNRESMESIDTRGSLEGKAGSRHGALSATDQRVFAQYY